MASIDGYDTLNYATFDNESEQVQQLPSLPVDEVLPKADADINDKQVKFKEPPEESTEKYQDANVILPKEPPKQPEVDYFAEISEYLPYIFAVLFIAIAYYFSQRY